MAVSVGMSSLTTTLGYATVGGGVYTSVAEVTDVAVDGVTVDQVDLTHLNSADATEESVPGLIRPGTITAGFNYTEAAFTILLGFLRTSKDWRITGPGLDTFDCTGYITNLGKAYPEDGGGVTMPLTVQLTGLPVYDETT